MEMSEEPKLKKEKDTSLLTTSSTPPKYELLQRCHKDFMSPFVGEVTAVPEGTSQYYQVLYEDGDVEDTTARQLRKHVAYYRSQELQKPQAKKKKLSIDGTKPMYEIGTKMMKDFPRTFEAEVIKVLSLRRPYLTYRIKYLTDGSEEDVKAEEMEELVKKFEAYEEYVKKPMAGSIADTKVEIDTNVGVKVDIDDVPLSKRWKIEEGQCSDGVTTPVESIGGDETCDDINNGDDDGDDVQLVSDTSTGLSHVKLEMFNKATARRVSANYEDRQRRINQRMLALKTLNGEPRKVFRRGCHKATITQVLGGSPMEPAPIVNNIPEGIFDNGVNPFIKKGEYYFAGRSDWNPWTPAYPGDVGFIESGWLAGPQETFHCFLDCAKKNYLPHYLGPKAKGKRLYLGRYRAVPDDADEVNVVEKAFMFKALEWDSKITMTEEFVKCDSNKIWFDDDGVFREATTQIAMEEYLQPAKLKTENEQEGLWDSLPWKKKQARAWVEMLLDKNFRLHIRPVEFVEYDEELYEKLVEIGADSGCVSLDERELGPL